MIEIGTGAITLGGGGGNWAARDPVARTAHLYLSPHTGRFARAGASAAVSQLGSFAAAGTRFERAGDGQYWPRGGNVPRLGDHTTGARRWLLEGFATNKCQNHNANPTTITGAFRQGDQSATLSLADDGDAIAAAGLAQLCPSGQVFVLDNTLGTGLAYVAFEGVAGNLNPHTGSAYIRGGAGDIRGQFAEGRVDFGASEGYRRVQGSFTPADAETRMVITAKPGQVIHFILNQFEEGPRPTSPIVVAGSAVTRAAETFVADLADLDLSGGVWVFFRGELWGENEPFPPLYVFGSAEDERVTLYLNRATGVLRSSQTSGGVSASINSPVYTAGSTLALAALYQPGSMSLVVGGAEVGTATPGALPDLAELILAARDTGGAGQPAALALAEFWIAPASAFTVAAMEALTA
ncbi:hypothetical protein [Pseudooceanicola sp. 200-1SW]|uniref:hypothetical protein n=1 Tax=Pseudooceanicola sp. 200-1SW TaxID=3425949 RepID=UPI003D7F5422